MTSAVYSRAKSGGRTAKETNLLSANEYNVAIETNFTVVNNRFCAKKEKFCEEVAELRNRIMASNTSGVDGLDDSDIEFLQDEIDGSDSDTELDETGTGTATNSIPATAEESTRETPETAKESTRGVFDGSENDDSIDDILSGDIPFTATEFKDRYYQMYDVGLRSAIVQCLIAWNSSSPFSTVIYDKRFVGVLLKEVFRDELTEDHLDEAHLEFMKRLFDVRVKGDINRVSKFHSIVAEKCLKAKNRGRANSVDNE